LGWWVRAGVVGVGLRTVVCHPVNEERGADARAREPFSKKRADVVVLTVRTLLDAAGGGVQAHRALQMLRNPVTVLGAGANPPTARGCRSAHGARSGVARGQVRIVAFVFAGWV
jgi:hypothetical protein